MAITIREYGTPDAGNLVAAYDASCGSSVTEFHSSLNALSKHKPAPRALSGASLSDEEWKDALNKVPDRRELSIDKVTAACQLIDKLKAGQDLNAPEAIMVDDVFGFLKSFVNPNRPHEHPEIETSRVDQWAKELRIPGHSSEDPLNTLDIALHLCYQKLAAISKKAAETGVAMLHASDKPTRELNVLTGRYLSAVLTVAERAMGETRAEVAAVLESLGLPFFSEEATARGVDQSLLGETDRIERAA